MNKPGKDEAGSLTHTLEQNKSLTRADCPVYGEPGLGREAEPSSAFGGGDMTRARES